MRFTANWYCTTDVEPAWDLRPTGWRVRVRGDAPLDVDLAFPVPLDDLGVVHARVHREPAGERGPVRVRGAARHPLDGRPAADHAGRTAERLSPTADRARTRLRLCERDVLGYRHPAIEWSWGKPE